MNRQIVLKSRPVGIPTNENFQIKEVASPVLADGELLLKARVISVDPYMRGRMSDAKSYAAPYELGMPISGGVVAEVVESRDAKYKVGDTVVGMFPWQEVFVAKANEATKVDGTIAPLGYYLGILGMPGITAYFGLLDIGKPQEGETVVVSGAAGAVGMVVGQIAKLKGAHVVGIAGDDEKTAYLKNELGFDEVINYRTSTNIFEDVAKACPNGVDVYFDNVGGEISDAVIEQINVGARIAICGQISLYNSTERPMGPRVQVSLLKKSALMQGFIVSKYANRFGEGVAQLAKWIAEGKLTYKQTVTKGFDNLPNTFIGLFEGANMGKALVEVE